MQWKGNLTIILALVMIGTGFVSMLGFEDAGAVSERTRASLTPHAPIHIYKNMSEKATQEGWAGTGIEGDPYIIEDLEIDAAGHTWGMFISSTQEHFVIRNCTVKNADIGGGQYKANIYFINVTNATLENNLISDSEYQGMTLRMCRDITVRGNAILGSNSSGGIYVWQSNDIEIVENKVNDNHYVGIAMSSSDNIRVFENTLTNNGISGISLTNSNRCVVIENQISGSDFDAIRISGSSARNEFYSNEMSEGGFYFYFEEGAITSAVIPQNNTVDGSPIHYYANENMTGRTLTGDVGQVILGNVTGLTISDITFNKGSPGIQVRYGSDLSVEACTFEDLYMAMVFKDCTQTDLLENEISRIEASSISLERCTNFKVAGNEISEALNGLYQSDDCQGNIINGNTFTDCNEGISIHPTMFGFIGGSNNSYTHNVFTDCASKGIYAVFEDMSEISNNEFYNTGEDPMISAGIELFNTKNMTVQHNTIMNATIGIKVTGIYWGSSWHNSVISNWIEISRGIGLMINRSMGGEYSWNLVYRSTDFGIYVENSHSNIIDHNSFIENRGSSEEYSTANIQARDDSIMNKWSSESEGNYWSDWLTPDADGDGIVDEDYLIFGGEDFDTRPLKWSPVIFLSAPLDLVATAGDMNATLKWSEPEVNFDNEVIQYTIFRTEGDDPTQTAMTIDGSQSMYVDEGLENNIEYHYTIVGENKYGKGEISQEVLVTPDGTPPLLEILSPSDGSVFNTTTVPFYWTGADDVSFDHFEIRIDDSEWIQQDWNTSANLTHISEGEHTFFLAGFDSVGNRNEINISFTVDLTKPIVWFTMIPDDGSLIINTSSLELIWNGTDEVGLDMYEISIDDGPFVDASLTYSTVLTELTEGDHIVHIKVWDLAGNWNITMATFKVDLTSPIVHIVHPVDGWKTVDTNLTVVWFVIENEEHPLTNLIMFDGGEWIDIGPATEYDILDLSAGVHNVSIRTIDGSGRIGENSTSFQVFEDEIPPVIVSISGSVTDEDGDPIEGVKVTSDDGAETRTDSNGDFILSVEQGPRILTFEKSGYEDITRSVDANENLTLSPDDLELEEIEEEEPLWRARTTCYICCGIPAVILLIMIFIWIVVKASKRGNKDYYPEDEE